MKTITYRDIDGKEHRVEYDETAPCIYCGEPIIEASMGGTALCPWCDCGHCRYCGGSLPLQKEDRLEHMRWHKQQREKGE